MRMSKSPWAYWRVAPAISRMGLTSCMVVTEAAAKAIISTTKAVMKNRPVSPCHIASSDPLSATAKASPAVSPVSGFTAGTPTMKRLASYSPPRVPR